MLDSTELTLQGRQTIHHIKMASNVSPVLPLNSTCIIPSNRQMGLTWSSCVPRMTMSRWQFYPFNPLAAEVVWGEA